MRSPQSGPFSRSREKVDRRVSAETVEGAACTTPSARHPRTRSDPRSHAMPKHPPGSSGRCAPEDDERGARSLSALGNLRPLPHFSPPPRTRARLPSLPVRSEIMTSGWAGGVGWEGVDPPLQDRIIVTRRTVTSGRSGCCTLAKGRNAAGSGGFVWSGAGRGQYLAVKSEAVSTRSFPARPTLAKTAEYPPLRQGLAGTASRHQPEGKGPAGVLACPKSKTPAPWDRRFKSGDV
jgi:hypothetical protein